MPPLCGGMGWIPYDEVREGGGRDNSTLHVILLGVIAYGH